MKKFIACDKTFADASIVLFGAPYDATSTYRKGSRFAPNKIREESFGIETYSPYCDRDLEDLAIHDAGDLQFKNSPSGRRGGREADGVVDPAPMVYAIEAQTEKILSANKFPIMLGGEHLVTLGAFRAIHQKYPDVCIIHFDAHTDLRDNWEGQKLNHSTVISRCYDVIADPRNIRIFQFGIRSGERAEFEFAKFNTHLCKHNFATLKDALKAIGTRPVYFTVDLDILDPSEMGGTGTPEAGGVTFLELLDATQKIFQTVNVVGCDINELSPPYDHNGASTALACKYLREVLLLCQKH
jgi:agmatinase